MEAKLKAYRAKKSREETIKKVKSKIAGLFQRMADAFIEINVPVNQPKEVELKTEDDLVCEVNSSETSESVDELLCDNLTWSKFLLYGSLWIFLYVLAIHAEFGAVYFAISLLYIIWRNTRTRTKKPGEISAYSVFNPNCEAIDGTINAEQFEKEIRYGAFH